jgi:hypothetical protein
LHEPSAQATPVLDGLPGEAGAAFDLAGVEPIINHGAQVKWQYAGVEYQATSNPVINGRRIFLPIIVRGAG